MPESSSGPGEFNDLIHRFSLSSESESEYRKMLFDTVSSRLPQLKGVTRKADSIAAEAHRGVRRGDDAPYIIHPRRVALLISHLPKLTAFDTSVVLPCALLHDVLEDTKLTRLDLTRLFSPAVADCVWQLSAMMESEAESKDQRRNRKVEKYRRMETASDDVFLVYAMDLVDNSLSWRFLDESMPFFRKLPRWIHQVEEFQLPTIDRRMPFLARLIERNVSNEKMRGLGPGGWDDA